jgi:hypothetical protein
MVTRPSNVLVDAASEGLPKAEGSGDPASFVVVCLTGDVSDAVDRLEATNGGADEVHVVHHKDASGADGFDSVYEVERPDDLAGMSMRIGNCISDSRGDDLYLYFGTVTELTEHVDTMTAYRFLNALTGRVRNADGVGYFGARRGEGEPEAMETFNGLFDRVYADAVQ